jgi:DNA-binding response OmpR family regulator
MRLLLIEDEDRLAGTILTQLRRSGFVADRVGTAADADHALTTVRYDAVVLDLGLPDRDGLQVLAALRGRGDGLPVLVLSARGELDDRVDALNRGADDYLPKPFEAAELVARLKALLRRPSSFLGRFLEAGPLRLDTVAREVTVDGKPVALTRRETDLLEHLLRRNGRVVPKEFLEEKLYGFGDEVASNSVEVVVHRLRKRLDTSDAGTVIHTVRGVGYFLSVQAP